MINFQEFLNKFYTIQEKFNSKGEFIRDNPEEKSPEPSPEEKERLKSLIRTNRVPNMTYAERQRIASTKTPEQVEQEKQRRMELARKMLQNP